MESNKKPKRATDTISIQSVGLGYKYARSGDTAKAVGSTSVRMQQVSQDHKAGCLTNTN